LLPALADMDLYVEGQQLEILRAEAELILQNIDQFVEEAGAASETLRFRIQNVLKAALRAIESKSGVVIW
jgi:hypothetical protein